MSVDKNRTVAAREGERAAMDQIDNVLWDNAESASRVCLYIAPENVNKIKYIFVRIATVSLCFSVLPSIVRSVPLVCHTGEKIELNRN